MIHWALPRFKLSLALLVRCVERSARVREGEQTRKGEQARQMQHAHNGERARRVREGGQKAQRDKSPRAVLYQHGEVRPSCVRGRETGPRDPSNWGEYVMGVIGHGPGPNARRSVESTYIRLEKYRKGYNMGGTVEKGENTVVRAWSL